MGKYYLYLVSIISPWDPDCSVAHRLLTVMVLCCSKNADHASVCWKAVPIIVCHLSDALLKSSFFQLWKFSQVAILKVEHCVLLHLKAYLFQNKTLYFWFLISKIFARRLFENQNPNFRKFWLFIFFSKNNLDYHFQNTRNYGGTHRLPDKTNRNVLAWKLRPVRTFQKR